MNFCSWIEQIYQKSYGNLRCKVKNPNFLKMSEMLEREDQNVF